MCRVLPSFQCMTTNSQVRHAQHTQRNGSLHSQHLLHLVQAGAAAELVWAAQRVCMSTVHLLASFPGLVSLQLGLHCHWGAPPSSGNSSESPTCSLGWPACPAPPDSVLPPLALPCACARVLTDRPAAGWHMADFLLRGYFKGKRDAEAHLAATFPTGGVALRPGFIYGSRAVGLANIPLGAVGAPLELVRI